MSEVSDLTQLQRPGFDLDYDAFDRPTLLLSEEELTVNSCVGPFLPLLGDRPRSDFPEGPPLELVAVELGQCLGAGPVLRLAVDYIRNSVAVRVLQAATYERDGKVGDVDSDLTAVELLG